MFRQKPPVVPVDEIYHWVQSNCTIETDVSEKYPNDPENGIARKFQEFLYDPKFQEARGKLNELQLKEVARVHALESRFNNGIEALSYIKRIRGGGKPGKLPHGSSGSSVMEDPIDAIVNYVDNYCHSEVDLDKKYPPKEGDQAHKAAKERAQAQSAFDALKSLDPKFAFFIPYRNRGLLIRHAVAKRHVIKPFTSAADIDKFIEDDEDLRTATPRGTKVVVFSSKLGSGSFREMLLDGDKSDDEAEAGEVVAEDADAAAGTNIDAKPAASNVTAAPFS